MTVLKLEIIIGEEYHSTTRRMYFDVDAISGFYVSDPEIVEGVKMEPIMCYCQGDFIAFTPDERLKKFLKKKFIDGAK